MQRNLLIFKKRDRETAIKGLTWRKCDMQLRTGSHLTLLLISVSIGYFTSPWCILNEQCLVSLTTQ